MKRQRLISLVALSIFWTTTGFAQVVNDEFFTENILGEWYGEVIYPDPQSQEMVYMPVKMAFQKEFRNSYLLEYNYNNQPGNNLQARCEILEEGNVYANADVVSAIEYCPDELDMVTETEGVEENMSVKYVYTYFLSEDQYEVTTEVVYPNTPGRALQNEYCMYRKNR